MKGAFTAMDRFPLFIMELQMAKRKLLSSFELPDVEDREEMKLGNNSCLKSVTADVRATELVEGSALPCDVPWPAIGRASLPASRVFDLTSFGWRRRKSES
jgi:hypothetical protein